MFAVIVSTFDGDSNVTGGEVAADVPQMRAIAAIVNVVAYCTIY